MKLVEVLADNQISRRKQEVFSRVTPRGLVQLMEKDKVGETVFDLFEEKTRRSDEQGLEGGSDPDERQEEDAREQSFVPAAGRPAAAGGVRQVPH